MTTPLLEKLAALEHDQWVKWSKELAEKERLSPDRVERWKQFWVPYEELDEATKEHDRKWARQALFAVVAEMDGKFSGYEYFTKQDKADVLKWIQAQMEACRGRSG